MEEHGGHKAARCSPSSHCTSSTTGATGLAPWSWTWVSPSANRTRSRRCNVAQELQGRGLLASSGGGNFDAERGGMTVAMPPRIAEHGDGGGGRRPGAREVAVTTRLA
jgi:hypothetical protein